MFTAILIIIVVLSIWLIISGTAYWSQPLEKFQWRYSPYFINGYINHNEITKIKKGECLLKIENKKLFIVQGDNQIEDNIEDINSIRVWLYEKSLYLAISTKTHSEYKFSLYYQKPGTPEAGKWVYNYHIKSFYNLAQKLNVPFENCGDSTDD